MQCVEDGLADNASQRRARRSQPCGNESREGATPSLDLAGIKNLLGCYLYGWLPAYGVMVGRHTELRAGVCFGF